MADEQDITESADLFTGEDKVIQFTITDQTITGWALSWMVKRRATDADANALITKTTAAGGITITGANTCEVALTDDDSSTLRADTYRHELKRTDAGLETVLSSGACTFRQAVHR